MPIDLSVAESEGAVLGWTTSRREAVKLSVEEYLRLIDLGVFQEDPVELLEGVVTQKMIKKPRHVVVQESLGALLRELVPAGWFVSEQNPVETADSMPEPDCKIVRGRLRDFRERLPTASDLALVVEVSDRSLKQDRELKGRIYARARVPVYWIVNLIDDLVEVYSEPTSRPKLHYKSKTEYRAGERLPLTLDDKKVASLKVDDFLL